MVRFDGNKGLLLFTIGPVQSYIETARKTQDLYMGSYMISYLIFNTIKLLLDYIPSEDIIFPSVDKESLQTSSVASFPNRFLAIVPLDKAEKIAIELENKVRTEMKNIADFVMTKYECDQLMFLKQKPWDFCEIYWVITSPKPKESYAEFYDRTEKSLGSVKNLKMFCQTQEDGIKCSLCGQRQVVARTEGDGLCSVCMIKRKANNYFLNMYKSLGTNKTDYFASFPSTAEIAAAKFKEKLFSDETARELYTKLNSELENILGKHLNYVKPVPKLSSCVRIQENSEGQWLYEESIDPDYIKRETGLEITREDISNILNIRKELINLVKDEPDKYYAIISMDGDNMGKWLSGSMALHPDKVTKEMHWSISRSLLDYNKMARDIVEKEYLGKLIYAGGDDVFALINIDGLLEAAIKLRKAFPKFEENIGSKERSTASMGICIAYYRDPLSRSINKAREMEQRAKNYPGKNAIGISNITSSGQEKTIICSWDQLQDIINLSNIIYENVSKSFTKNLWLEFSRITTDGVIVQKDLQESFKLGILRRLYRNKKATINKEEYEKKIIPLLYERLVSVIEGLHYDLKSFFDALEIISILAGE